MDPYERSKLADALTTVRCKKGEYIVKQGEKGDKFYIIEEGELVAEKIIKKGTFCFLTGQEEIRLKSFIISLVNILVKQRSLRMNPDKLASFAKLTAFWQHLKEKALKDFWDPSMQAYFVF